MKWVGAALLAALILLVPAPAGAHALLVGTSPTPGRLLSSPPVEVVLGFSEAVTPVPGQVRVLGPDGGPVSRGEPVVTDAQLRLAVPARAAEGTYVVTYRVVSADGHPVSGAFTYVVGHPTSAGPVSEASGADPWLTAGLAGARWLGYAGLALLAGSVLFAAPAGRRRIAVGVALVAAGTVAELALAVPYTGLDLPEALTGRTGVVHLARIALLAAAVPFLLRPRGRALSAIALLAPFTWALAGHPGTSPAPGLTVLADAVHVAAAALWLGGLVALLAAPDRLGAWSRAAPRIVAALAASGVVAAVVELGPPAALLTTGYGRLLLVKAVGLTVLLGLAAVARRRVARGVPVLRLVLAEITLLAAVAGVAAVLTGTPPARTASLAVDPALPYSGRLTCPLYDLRVEMDPARVGANSVHLWAQRPDGSPLPVLQWQATAAHAGVAPIDLELRRITADHAIGDAPLPLPGRWTLTFTLRTTDIDQRSVTTVVLLR